MVELFVPTLGESVSEATIAKWYKKEGDAVKADELLVELETDKVNLEVNAPTSGRLGKISFVAGDTVKRGDLLVIIEEGATGNIAASASVPVAAAARARSANLPATSPPARSRRHALAI